MTSPFPNLFSEIALGPCVVPNRIVSTGHHTYLSDQVPDDRLITYHEARAKGGAGLIISEIVAVHETAGFSANLLTALKPDVIPAYARLVDACHAHGTVIFAQLFHPGREVASTDHGMLPVAYAPSAVPNERFHIMPKVMSLALIRDIVAGFGRSAALLAEAGFDGFEIVASHGYLPAQFLNPCTNLRDDAYGGDAERRLRFLRDVIAATRAAAGDRVLGVRLSADEMSEGGLTVEQTRNICLAIAGDVDYLSIVAGTSASLGGSVHIVPPMGEDHAYVAPMAKAIKRAAPVPIIVAGRINQPQIAEQIIASGQADLCGMARALICDPDLASKARRGRLGDIRACIGCNQSCIGRAHKGLGISCIQHPETGRELEFQSPPIATGKKRVLVAGGGPAGMKAAAIAAARGYDVSLYEREHELGGQVRLAQRLPGREEFGGITNNLQREMSLAGASVFRGTPLTIEQIRATEPDIVVLATGAEPYVPMLDGLDQDHVVTAWDVLTEKAEIGATVVVADWRADWIGLGLAERLAKAGRSVTLAVNAAIAGETMQLYTRNHYVGRLHGLDVGIRTHLRLFGVDEDTVYMQNTLTGEAVLFEGIETLVLSLGHQPVADLEHQLEALGVDYVAVGDCVAARTVEEAVYEALKASWMI